ncbi:BioF2-like, acetyltransferase domain containing protein [Oxalobacteraceae bacterium]
MSNHLPVSVTSLNLESLAATQSEALPLGTDIVSEIYKHSVPAFASLALDRLQGSLYASLRYLELSDPEQTPPNTWVGYRSGEIVSVLLFRVDGKRVTVLCEVVTLDSVHIDAFAVSVFSNFTGIRHIVFNAVSVSVPPSSFPTQFFSFSENYVLNLPPSTEAYMAVLGKSTRQSLRGYRNRLLRDFPEFSWTAYTCDELTLEQQRQLVLILQRFKRDSMTARGKSAAIDETETQHFLAMAAECGLFGVAQVNGRICAGAFSCRIGDSYVMLLSASDPAMSAYRLGLLTCLWSVTDCINEGGRQCHMLWGRYQYKHQLLAEPKSLYRLIVYPSVTQMLMQPIIVMQIFFHGFYVRSVQGLQNYLEKEKSPGWQWLYYRLRSLKKSSEVFREKFKYMSARNQGMAPDISMAASFNDNRDRGTVGDAVITSRTNAIGTATHSRCPLQAL